MLRKLQEEAEKRVVAINSEKTEYIVVGDPNRDELYLGEEIVRNIELCNFVF